MQTKKRRVGVFGGSFDPPHIGHLICARAVAEAIELDRILIIPTAIQPGKPEGSEADALHRWEMVNEIVSGDSLFKPLRIEIDRGGISYTVETLQTLRNEYIAEKADLFLILGFDSAAGIGNWREPDRIIELAKIVVMQRVGIDYESLPEPWCGKMIIVNTPVIEISSSDIKRRLRNKLPIRIMTSEGVETIIEKNKLYSQVR